MQRFATLTIATLALSIAGVTIVFTLVHSVLLKPLPYPDSDRLVILWERQPNLPTLRTVRTADFIDWRDASRSFESMALFRPFVSDIDVDAAPVRVQIWSVSPEFFPMLGAQMVIGRSPDSSSTAVISYEFWQARYGTAPDVLGKTLQFPQNTSVTIVGVMAPGFRPPLVGLMASNRTSFPEIWQAYQPTDADITNRRRGGSTAIARLKTGVSIEAANAEIEAIERRLAAAHPDTNAGMSAGVTPLLDEVVGNVRSVLWIFFGAVCCVLMIGIGNLISLQMVHNSARRREMLIRAALGASRARLLRQLLTETLLLSMAGCALGLLAAEAGIRILLQSLPAGFPRTTQVGIDTTVFLFSVGASLVAWLTFGTIPAFRACRPDLNDALKNAGGMTSSRKETTLLRGLIAFETALALILLIGASLLVHSFWRLVTAETGMNESNAWTVSITLPPKYRGVPDQSGFFLRALQRVRDLPEVESAGLVTVPPLAGIELMMPAPTPDGVTLSVRAVTADYFRTMGIPVLKGRLLQDSDVASDEHVAVINESAARALWPGEEAIGRRIVSGRSYTVIGVIPDIKMRRLDMASSPQIYSSFIQEPVGADLPVTLMARARASNRSFGSTIRKTIQSLDSDVTVGTATVEDVRWRVTATERFRTILLLMFAATALFLAVVGIFGVVSYAAVQRIQEIGLRVALGADRRSVTRLMIRQSMTPALIGAVAGVVASSWLTRLLSGFLYEVLPTDLLTFTAAVVALTLAAFVASYLPARRASRVDPMVALRCE